MNFVLIFLAQARAAFVISAVGALASATLTLGAGTAPKVTGAAMEVASDIVHPNGNVYDQVLLSGASASVTADPRQITRVSFVDPDDDIVQVEFSGAGTLSLTLDGASGPSAPVNYNQPDVAYMKGRASIVIGGADETSDLSVFSVGRANAMNQRLFREGVSYGGVADVAFIVIMSAKGRFGGLRAANANFASAKGTVGIYARGVHFGGPVYIGNLTAAGFAAPKLIFGATSGDVQVNGGDLAQVNGEAVEVSGVTALRFLPGTTSHGVALPARVNRARFVQDGVDVTRQIVADPP